VSKKEITNVPASILQRLRDYSIRKHEGFGLTLSRYSIERLLYRLTKSKYVDQFVLKGAQLFRLWSDIPFRPTRDLDLLRFGSADIRELIQIFQEICRTASDIQDGIEFLPETVRGESIREQAEYDGIRIKLEYRIGKTGQFMQIDIGFGDAIVPVASEISFPSMLGMPSAKLRSYSRETVIAEKVEAMVSLGRANSRMKDFFDVYQLSQEVEFDGRTLQHAVQSTFSRRKTAIPQDIPLAFIEELSGDISKRGQWTAFVARAGGLSGTNFEQVIQHIGDFIAPVFQAIGTGGKLALIWRPGQGWKRS
jgi:predicted nucleotidyltransferase component of viral defense system